MIYKKHEIKEIGNLTIIIFVIGSFKTIAGNYNYLK